MNITQTHRNKGFTLIELMVVVGIVAITMGVGMPGFQSAIASNRLTASANDMVVALQLGRSEAIKQMKMVGVKFNNDSSWDTVVFGTPDVVKQSYIAASGVTYTSNASVLPSDVAKIGVRYRSDGRIASNTPIIVEFSIAGNTVDKRRLRIQPSGQVKVCTIPAPDTEPCPF